MIYYMDIISTEKTQLVKLKGQMSIYHFVYSMNQRVKEKKEDIYKLKKVKIRMMLNYKHLKYFYHKNLGCHMIRFLKYH